MIHLLNSLFFAILCFPALKAETIYIASYAQSPCNKFEILGAYQLGAEILVPCLNYIDGECHTTPAYPSPIMNSIEVDGPALLAKPLREFLLYGRSEGEPVVLSAGQSVLSTYQSLNSIKAVSSLILDYVEVQNYPWVYHYALGWLYVIPAGHSDLEQFREKTSAYNPYSPELRKVLQVINTYWFYNEAGDWLYGDFVISPYLYNASNQTWVNTQPDIVID